jgi:glycerophosphoryl diester phosphodiesterase
MLRVGHGGAGALARANTLESFDAALDHGVDMIEFDVRAHHGRLVLAHDALDARRRPCVRLERALSHLSDARFDGVHFNVDVKQLGVEAATLFALERFGLTDRALISSHLPLVLDRMRKLDPSVRTGVSIGNRLLRHRQHWGDWRVAVAEAVGRRRFDAVMANHRIVDSALVAAIRAHGGELYAWTVDDRSRVDRMRDAGVTGVITNDPRIFQPLTATA